MTIAKTKATRAALIMIEPTAKLAKFPVSLLSKPATLARATSKTKKRPIPRRASPMSNAGTFIEPIENGL